jgi:beta-glucosidase
MLSLSTVVAATVALSLNSHRIAASEQAAPLWPDGKQAAISLSFDDARPSQVDVGVPLLDRYGVKATFYVTPSRLKERLPAWKLAVAAGHEIGNHTLTHPCTGNFEWSRNNALEMFTLERMKREIVDSNREISDLLGVTPRTFAYPCGQKFVGQGQVLKSYVPLVAEIFLAGRGWLDEGSNDPAFCDLSQVLAVEADNHDFEQIRPLIEQASRQGRWLILAGHEIGDGDKPQTIRVSMIESVCKYAGDPGHRIWIDTVASVAARVANVREALSSAAKAKSSESDSNDRKVEDLLSRMTLEEKVGQINMPCVYEEKLGKSTSEKMEACRKLAAGIYETGLGPGGGFFTLANTILQEGSRQQAEFFNALQKIAVEKTRLKIPLLETEEGTHGAMRSGATVFPEGSALGSMWNADLIEKIYSVAAREARAVGIHQLFTLVIEPNRDPRLGRNQEGYGEDPYLCARIAEAIVKGVQGESIGANDKVVAGLCHYPGQSQPASGLERGAMEISERMLREVFLPPWVAGIKRGGALGVMATYPAIDGTPVHASEFILTRILRGELGFQGLVLSEGSGISTLLYEGLAPDQKTAGALALKAGVDVGISYEKAYMQDLIAAVREGVVPVEEVDRSVRRILRLKFRLGLFENPYVDVDRAAAVSHTPQDVALALQAAREGTVLLKNHGNLLPLPKDVSPVAVIGPNAADARNQLGDYTPHTVLSKVVTILAGIRSKLPAGAEIRYAKGCDVLGGDRSGFAGAIEAARKSRVAIVVVGENEWQAQGRKGTDGEGYDSATLELTGNQEDLVKAVVETGTPTVVVLVNGRPLATRWIAEHVPALLESWISGEQGGQAVADILFGDYNPSGRLSITVPRHAGQLPVFYNYKPSKAHWLEHGWGKPYVDMDPGPLFVFGHGLSYTRFDYSNLHMEPQTGGPGDTVRVSVDVQNTGNRTGAEVVQLYLHVPVSSVTRAVQQLRGFRKVTLAPGEKQTVRMELGPEELSLLDRDMRWIVEPGKYEVRIGSSSKDIRQTGTFEIKNQ